MANTLARTLVRNVLHAANPEPLHTHRIFALTQDVPIDPEAARAHAAMNASILRRTGVPQPPAPDHPIRSIRYLKHVVLPDLEQRDEVVKVKHQRPPTEFEVELAARTKPPTRSQRKRRGAGGPGQRPVTINSGLVFEFAWRLKQPDEKSWREQQEVEAKIKAEKKVQKQKIKLVKRKEKHPTRYRRKEEEMERRRA